MGSKYGWMEIVLGVVLILAPFVGRFSAVHPASYTDVIVGVLLVLLALFGMKVASEGGSGMHGDRAFRAKP